MNYEELLNVLYEIRKHALSENRTDHAEALLKAIDVIEENEMLCENIKVANQKIEELQSFLSKFNKL